MSKDCLKLFIGRFGLTAALFLAHLSLVITPDLIFSAVQSNCIPYSNIKSWLFVLTFAAVFTASNSRRWDAFWLIFFGILQVAQFCHMQYFHVQISPTSYYLMSLQFSDVLSEGVFDFWRYFWVLPAVLLPFCAMYWLNVRFAGRVHETRYAPVAMLVMLGAVSGLGLKDISRYNPNYVRFTINNSFKSICGFFVMKCSAIEVKEYKPYRVTRRDNVGPRTVVLIIGESSNYRHMSLFGYVRQTTPLLEEMAKREDFYFTHGVSGGVITYASCKYLLNATYEPDNYRQNSSDTTNLFKLAKQNGFKTFYISAQSDSMVSAMGGTQYVDVMITYERAPLLFAENSDLGLLTLIGDQEYGDKNFVVVHQWCVHSPYKKQGVRSPVYDKFARQAVGGSETDRLIADYDAAMTFNDSVIAQIFQAFNRSGNYYIAWTSDHNDLLGEGGIFGHGHGVLVPDVAQVPFLIQSNDPEFLDKFRGIYLPTHYELVKLIAYELGYDIENDNEIPGQFYVSGADYNGQLGYMKLTRDSKKKTVKYTIVN